jgi:hypothetical protein
MQSASVLPPPPGALGADSLWLPKDELGESARLGCGVPPEEICVGSCGDSGGMGASSGMGAAIADGVVLTSVAGGGAEVPLVTIGRVAGADAGADVAAGAADTGVVPGGVKAAGRGTARC